MPGRLPRDGPLLRPQRPFRADVSGPHPIPGTTVTKLNLARSSSGDPVQGLSSAALKTAIFLPLLLACGLHNLLLKDGFYAATMDDNGRTLDALAWSQGRIPHVGVCGFHAIESS
jgi:hypothetical protein